MKQLNQLINHLLILIGIRHNIVSAKVHNNYLVYCRDTDKYYNLLPIKVNQKVLYNKLMFDEYKVISIKPNNRYIVRDIYEFHNDKTVNGDNLYPYIPDSTVRGYIKGVNFIVIE